MAVDQLPAQPGLPGSPSLIAGSALASVVGGPPQPAGPGIAPGPLQPVFQGERATVPVLHLHAAHGLYHRHGVSLAMNRSQGKLAWVHTDVEAGLPPPLNWAACRTSAAGTACPGWCLKAVIRWACFRLWSYWQPDGRVLVYPCPEAPPIHHLDDASDPGSRLPQRKRHRPR